MESDRQRAWEDWSAACACAPEGPDRAGGARASESIRLTSQQRRELARLAAAAIVSTAIALAPAVSVHESEPPVLAASPIQIAGARLPAPRVAAPIGPQLPDERPRRARQPRVTAAAAEQAPLVATSLRERFSPDGAMELPGRPRRGGLLRVLVGSGRYKVQPFPQPAGGV